MTRLSEFQPAPANTPRVYVVVPARIASTRLPDKPLADVAGRTIIRRVATRAVALARQLEREGIARGAMALVAADDPRVSAEASASGARCFLTDPALPSGTDRVHAALGMLTGDDAPAPHDVVVNVQGDEPFFCLDDVARLVADLIAHPEAPMGTLAFPRSAPELFLRPSVVKVVVSAVGDALAFSRAPIPWPRGILGAGGLDWLSDLGLTPGSHAGARALGEIPFLHHVGVYAFRAHSLGTFARGLPVSALEAREGLEQLRALEAGWRIRVVTAHEEPFGIDTPDDLAEAIRRARAEA